MTTTDTSDLIGDLIDTLGDCLYMPDEDDPGFAVYGNPARVRVALDDTLVTFCRLDRRGYAVEYEATVSAHAPEHVIRALALAMSEPE
jgi:hypothetical protein